MTHLSPSDFRSLPPAAPLYLFTAATYSNAAARITDISRAKPTLATFLYRSGGYGMGVARTPCVPLLTWKASLCFTGCVVS